MESLSRSAWPRPTGRFLLFGLAIALTGLALGFEASGSPWGTLLLPLTVTAVATAIVGLWAVPWLQRLKTGQIIREDGPQAHLKKAGTPTMGGVFFVPVALAIALIWTQGSPSVVAVSLVTFAYGFIGWLDDWQVLRLKSNKGMSPRMKLLCQIAVAVVFCLWLFWQKPELSNVVLPLGLTLPLGLAFWALAGFVFVAESNATNLTDGVDGLAGGTGALALLGLGSLTLDSDPGLAIFCACLSGACLGFVVHNHNPARVFMGDTGSLALGGALAAVGILSGNLWGLFVVSGIFFLESLSVIAQVGYYKATKGPDGVGKRLFRMAPFHHHLELSGWAETQVVALFYGINGVLAILAFFLH